MQACRNGKNSGGLNVYQKVLDKLVSWLKRSFSGNRSQSLKSLNRVDVGNANFQCR